MSLPVVSPVTDTSCARRALSGKLLQRIVSFLAPLPLLFLSNCSLSLMDPAGPIGKSEKVILLDAVVIMLAIVIPTIAATLGFAWWFRATNEKAEHKPTWNYSGRVELIVWSIPALVVLFLGGIAWISSHDLDPAKPIVSKEQAIEIDVVSLDWKWLFIYPQQRVASLNRLVIPVGVPLDLHITSASVLNVFFVPKLGSEIYAMNGMVARLYLEADKAGIYPGLSAHFSGAGFANMAFDADARDAGAFTSWVAEARASGSLLDDEAYRDLLKQSANDGERIYRSDDTNLFGDIVSQKLPQGDGPPVTEKAATPAPQGGTQ